MGSCIAILMRGCQYLTYALVSAPSEVKLNFTLINLKKWLLLVEHMKERRLQCIHRLSGIGKLDKRMDTLAKY